MEVKKILEELNPFRQCKKYELPFWQCPNILFLFLGIITIILIFISYIIFSQYIQDPQIVALLVLLIAVILLVIAFIVDNSVQRLAEANRLKSEFINIVSHQLRAPISNLRWAIELLMSGRLGKIEEAQVEYFRILKENSTRMANLIRDLLVVSRLETARYSLKKEFFSLGELTKEVINDFLPFAKASNVEIKFSESKNTPFVFADKYQTRQVIENLLDNAIRYSKNKGLVEIKIEPREKKVFFEIEDNGVGIPKEDQKFIFQKLFRSSNVLKHQTQGTGLGLYISKLIIEKSQGKIGFKSQEGKGSIFWFYLPTK